MMSNSTQLNETFGAELSALKGNAADVRLQLSLASADAPEEWKLLDGAWAKLEGELARTDSYSMASVREIGDAARTFMDALKAGYARLNPPAKQPKTAADASADMVAEGAPATARSDSPSTTRGERPRA